MKKIIAKDMLKEENFNEFKNIVYGEFKKYSDPKNVNVQNMFKFWWSGEWVTWCNKNKDFLIEITRILHEEILFAYENIITKLENYEKNIIPYAGTLLGAVRNGALIPWDDDADFLADVKYMIDNEDKINKLANSVNWELRRRSQFNEEFYPIKFSGQFFDQLISNENILLEVEDVTIVITPTIDLFPSIRIKELNEKKLENFSSEVTKLLFEYYFANGLDLESEIRVAERVSGRKMKWAKENRLKKGIDNEKTKTNLQKFLTKYYSEGSKSSRIFSLTDSTKYKENFYYIDNNTYEKSVKNSNKEYIFNIPSNSEELLKSWYINWKEEKFSHSHMINPWNLKKTE